MSNLFTGTWHFGKSLGGRNHAIAELTTPKALFLSAAGASGHKRLSPIFHWLARHLQLATSQDLRARIIYTFRLIRDDDDVRSQLRRLLKYADLGIEGIAVRTRELSAEDKARVLRIAQAMAGETADIEPDERMWEEVGTVVELQHQCGDGTPPVGLPFESESLGTQVLVGLYGPALEALRDNTVLLIDEMDTSLHPHLVAELIRLFKSPTTNQGRAQLVFSTHETSLLGNLMDDTPVLDRDQVWLVEKDTAGATSVYPLTDFSPRRLENLERGYLQGRYGAVPFFGSNELTGTPGGAKAGQDD